MVAVPAHAAGDVQQYVIHELQARGDLGADDLGGMEVARVQRDHLAAGEGVAHHQLVGADGVALKAQREQLALNALEYELLVDLLGKDLVEGVDHAGAGGGGVGGDVLVAVGHPVVDDAGLAQLAAEFRADLAAALAVLNPEFAGLVVRAGEREAVVDHGMAEIGGVEVEADVLLLRPVHPVLELGDGVRVAVDLPAIQLGVAGVQVELLRAGDHGHGQIGVAADLVGVAGAAGIVACGGDAVGRAGASAFAAHNVVGLPAVHGDGQ